MGGMFEFGFRGKLIQSFSLTKSVTVVTYSLLSGVAWRDTTEERLGKIRTNKHLVTVSNSGTGVVGVRLNDKYNRYEVSWVTTAGRQGKTSVSVRKHGKEGAFIKVCATRQEKENARLDI